MPSSLSSLNSPLACCLLPIYFSVDGSVRDQVRDLQSLNAPCCISITPSGIINEPVRIRHALKARAPIDFNLSGSVSLVSVFFPDPIELL